MSRLSQIMEIPGKTKKYFCSLPLTNCLKIHKSCSSGTHYSKDITKLNSKNRFKLQNYSSLNMWCAGWTSVFHWNDLWWFYNLMLNFANIFFIKGRWNVSVSDMSAFYPLTSPMCFLRPPFFEACSLLVICRLFIWAGSPFAIMGGGSTPVCLDQSSNIKAILCGKQSRIEGVRISGFQQPLWKWWNY